jgi:glycosyltransferase involved in cell wall biosynthesis
LAYQEALASGVPILAWDQGWWLDPNRFVWGENDVPATSVPYFDTRCGLKFKNIEEFPAKFEEFVDLLQSNAFSPREYILENLTLEACARQYLDILDEVAQ